MISDEAHPKLSLVVSVRNKDGSLGDLAPADLAVKEDGEPVQVQELHKLSRPVLHYCVLFDTSNSQRSKFAFQQEVAAGLLTQILRPKLDHGWLALFDDDSTESNETDNPQTLVNTIRVSRPVGGTSFYDAVVQCTRRMEASPSEIGTRTMFTFSDGVDNHSRSNPNDAVEGALRASVRIYTFDSGNENTARGSRILKKLAADTGGQTFRLGRPKDVDRMAAEINDDLQHLFVLSLSSPNSASGRQLSKIEVKCVRKGVTVLAPKNIYLHRLAGDAANL